MREVQPTNNIKKGPPDNFFSCRPILSQCCYVSRKSLKSQIDIRSYDFLTSTKIPPKNQSGNKNVTATAGAIFSASFSITSAKEGGQLCLAVFCDRPKAFERIDHQTQLLKTDFALNFQNFFFFFCFVFYYLIFIF